MVHLFYVGWKWALEKITVSTRNKKEISNIKTQKYCCIFYQKQTSIQWIKTRFNDFGVKKSQRLKFNVDFVASESNLKKSLELASKWFQCCYNSPYLLSPTIFSAVSNLWCLLMSGYKRIWFEKS